MSEVTWPHDRARHADITARCLALQGVLCAICEDSCDDGAPGLVLRLGGKHTPLIDPKACTSCGARVEACPSPIIWQTKQHVREAQ